MGSLVSSLGWLAAPVALQLWWWHHNGGHIPWQLTAAVATLCTLAVARLIFTRVRAARVAAHWRDVAQRKRDQRENLRELHPVECTVDEQRQHAVLTATARQLRDMIARGSLTCSEVVSTYAYRASTLGAELNLNAEECFQEAAEAARGVGADAGTEALLRGVPVSIKDQYFQQGYDATCGAACKAFRPAEQDGLLVELLRDAGAIPFVRSNVPQCLMVPESDNYVWGQAKNPYNPHRTPGGSSGGEGGLVGGNCSPLGLGTDIGGSIRIPAHFCGVYGFKPTPTRVSLSGLAVPRPRPGTGQAAIIPSPGPLGRSVDDLVLVMRAWLVEKMWAADPGIPRLPFRLNVWEGRKKLRVGYFVHDGYFNACPTAERAMEETLAGLRTRSDVELVPFQPPDVETAVHVYYAIMGADSMRGFKAGLEGEKFHTLYAKLHAIARIPRLFMPLISRVLALLGETRIAAIAKRAGARPTHEHWDDVLNLQLYRAKFFGAWREAELDALVGPTLALPALRHGDSKEMTPAMCGTMLFNVLHMPAGVCPVTTVRKDECTYSCPKSQDDKLARLARKVMETAEGLPFTVQVAALPFQDEVALRVMKMIEDSLPVPFVVGSHLRAQAL